MSRPAGSRSTDPKRCVIQFRVTEADAQLLQNMAPEDTTLAAHARHVVLNRARTEWYNRCVVRLTRKDTGINECQAWLLLEGIKPDYSKQPELAAEELLHG